MRRSFLITAVLAAVLAVLTAGPAWAGGPTSVLVTSPSTGRSAALRTSDAEYRQLWQQVQVTEEGIAKAGKNFPAAPSGRQINVTWLLHDIQIHRVDQIFIDADGGPVIVSEDRLCTPEAEPAEPVRHTAADGTKLMALLKRLGLLAQSGKGTGSTGGVPLGVGVNRPEPSGEPDTAAPATAPAAAGDSSPLTGWWWALPGLAAGVAAGFLERALPRSRRGGKDAAPGPRQQLLDA